MVRHLIGSVLDHLYLHTDATGRIWASSGGPPYVVLCNDLESFLGLDLSSTDMQSVRVLGSPVNLDLIVVILDRIDSGHLPRLDLASPRLIGPLSVLQDPVAALESMSRLRVPSSSGGWGECRTATGLSFHMASCLKRGLDEVFEEFWGRHPMHKVVQAVSCDQELMSRWVAEVRDPRYYIDPRRPDRRSRWREYLGLRSHHVASVLRRDVSGGKASFEKKSRLRAFLDAVAGRSCTSHFSRILEEKSGTSDWRHLPCTDRSVEILTRLANRAAEYFRRNWMGILTGSLSEWFIAEEFFGGDKETESFYNDLVKGGKEQS